MLQNVTSMKAERPKHKPLGERNSFTVHYTFPQILFTQQVKSNFHKKNPEPVFYHFTK